MSDRFDRREFVKRGLAAAAAGQLLPDSPSRAADEDQLSIIDTHQHLWDLKRFRLPWIQPGSPLDRNFWTDDYLSAARGQNIEATVYMEVDVDPSQQSEEVAEVTEICRRGETPMLAAVVSGRPAAEDFPQYLARHKDNPYVRGMRQVLHGPATPPGYCLDKRFVAGIRALGQIGWSFDLCLRPAELPDAARLIDLCPDTRFVLDHCGNANLAAADQTPWKRDIDAVARRKNVVGKVSGFIASAPGGKWSLEMLAPIVNHTLAVFGPDRVMFGGDWPVCTLAASLGEWITALKTIVSDRPAEAQRKLFHDNAEAFYRLA